MRGWSRTEQGLALLVVLLSPFQDSGLMGTPLRYMGASFAIVPLLALCGLRLLRWSLSRDSKLRTGWLMAVLWVAAVNLWALLRHGPEWNGASLVAKTFNLGLMLALAAYAAFGIPWARFRWLPGAALAAYLISLAGVAVHDWNLGGLRPLLDNRLFHYGANPDTRWHGLAAEASVLSFTVGAQALLCMALLRSVPLRAALLAGAAVVLALCGSKGGLAVFAAALALAGLLMPGRRLLALLVVAGLVPLLPLAAERIGQLVSEQAFRETTTFSTRSAMWIWAGLAASQQPLGAGFAGFYPSLTRHLPEAMDRAAQAFPVIHNFAEVRSYLSTAQYAGTKTLFGDFLVYFGFPFVVLSVGFLAKALIRLRRRRDYWSVALLLFLCLGWTTYMSSLALYPGFLCLGAVRSLSASCSSRQNARQSAEGGRPYSVA